MSSPAKKKQVFIFRAPKMVCMSCSSSIEITLRNADKNNELIDVKADSALKRVTVSFYTDEKKSDKVLLAKYRKILADIDQKVEPYQRESRNRSIRPNLIKGAIGLVLGLTLLILSATGVGIPVVAMVLIALFGSAVSFYLGFPLYRAAFIRLFKQKKLSMEALFTVSTLTAIGVTLVGMFIPWLPMLIDAALLIFGFHYVGVGIREAITSKIVKSTTFRELPLKKVSTPSSKHKKMVKDLLPGEFILVDNNNLVPVDCECLSPTSVIEDIYDGQTNSKEVKAGYFLRAGARYVGKDPILLKVIHKEEDSYLAELDQEMAATQNIKPAPIETWAEKVLNFFVPAVFVIAAICGALMGVFFSLVAAIQCVIAVLVSACPCTLGIIPSLAFNIAANKGRKHDVEFKSAAAIEAAASIDTVVFDLNGTLTTGNPIVTVMRQESSKDQKQQILQYLLTLESGAKHKHQIAKAIYRYAEKAAAKYAEDIVLLPNIDVDESQSGVRAQINGEWLTLGNRTMMQDHGIALLDDNQSSNAMQQKIYLARGKCIIATLDLVDPLRPNAVEVVAKLKKTKNVYICTGADLTTALVYAKALKIPASHVAASCVSKINPRDPGGMQKLTKSAFIKGLQKKGNQVALVGDAGNDANAMTNCFGMAIRSSSSSQVTESKAKVLLLSDDLSPVLATFEISQQAVKNINQNFVISLIFNMVTPFIICLSAVGGFILNPGFGVAWMVAQMGVVFSNAYRFGQQSIAALKKLMTSQKNSTQYTMDSLPVTHSKTKNPEIAPMTCATKKRIVIPSDSGCHPERSEGPPTIAIRRRSLASLGMTSAGS